MTTYRKIRGARGGVVTLAAIALLGVAACSDDSLPSAPSGNVSVSIVAPADSMFEGDLIQLGAHVVDATGVEIPGAQITWSVSDPALAAVNATGKVLLLKAGTVRVTATNGDRSATKELGINPLVVKEVVLEPSSFHLGRGDVVSFSVKVKGPGGRQINGRDVQITSDDENIAVTGSQGFIVARGAGATNVRVKVDDVTSIIPVDVVVADTTFDLTEFNGLALPVLFASDSVEWNGVKEFHELYIERGTFVLSGLQQLRYKVEIKYSEYNVITENGAVRRELRRVGSEFDRGIVDVGAAGHLAMTSEYIWPLAHTADLASDGYLVHFRLPGDDIIWNVKYRRVSQPRME